MKIIEYAKQVLKVYKFDNSPEMLNYKLLLSNLLGEIMTSVM